MKKMLIGGTLLLGVSLFANNLIGDINKLSETGGEITISTPIELMESVTIPENVILKFTNKGCINIDKEATLTINGEIDAGARTIFVGSGSVNGSVRALTIPIQWFGANANDNIDDSEAIQKAANFAQFSLGRKLLIPSGNYNISGTITIRCNVDCFGILHKMVEIDEDQTQFLTGTFTHKYFPKVNTKIIIAPDDEEILLDPSKFDTIKAGSFKVSNYSKVKTLNYKDEFIDLKSGGTLNFSSTNFFSSRRNVKGDQYYTAQDFCKLVSDKGDVFPEFCFNYGAINDVENYDNSKIYKRGDFVRQDGTIFKATYPSGGDSSYTHRVYGKVSIPSVEPDAKLSETLYHYNYENDVKDSICIWVKMSDRIAYIPPQQPLTINGLNIEVRGVDPENRTKPTIDETVLVNRSNVTLNNINISCKDRLLLLSTLMNVKYCSSIVFNNGVFSGATYHGLGYNILQLNVADITYNNCISTNARDGETLDFTLSDGRKYHATIPKDSGKKLKVTDMAKLN